MYLVHMYNNRLHIDWALSTFGGLLLIKALKHLLELVMY